MTINKIQNLEAGGDVREKLNAVIDAANEVPNKVAKNPYAVAGNVAVWGQGGVLLDAGVQPGGGDQVNVPTWESVKTIPLPVDFVVQYNDKLFRNKVLDNFNNEPPLEGENSFWIETSKSQANSTPLWAAGTYISERAEVYFLDNSTNTLIKYVLRAPAPFVSSDFVTELNLGYWQKIEGAAKTFVSQVSELQLISGAKDGDTVGVVYDANDNVELMYKFNAASTSTPTSFTVVKPSEIPTASPGRWVLKHVNQLTMSSRIFSLPVGSDSYLVEANSSFYLNAVNGRTSFAFNLMHPFYPSVPAYSVNRWFIIIDNSANSSAMSFTLTGPSNHTVDWVGSAAVTSIAAGKKARIEVYSALKTSTTDIRLLARYSQIGESSAAAVVDYENIFFEVAAPDKAYITRGFNWKIASSTEYGGTSTIKTSGGATYTTGATVTAGDYLTVTNTTINARLVAIIQPA